MTSQKDDGSTGYRYHRRSTRLSKHDYTRGIYFVTVRTQTHDPLFEIPQLRAILEETWQALPQRFPGVTLDEFVIMPDHVHFILRLDGQGDTLLSALSLISRHWQGFASIFAITLKTWRPESTSSPCLVR